MENDNKSRKKVTWREDMTREERIHNLMTKKKKPANAVKKLIREGDTSIRDNLDLMVHGVEFQGKVGKDLSYTDTEILTREGIAFLQYCDEKNMVPTMTGLALWLGLTHGTLTRWMHDSRNPHNFFLQKMNTYFHRFAEEKAMDGSLSPLIYFFQAKNYWGMSDRTEIVHKSQSTQTIDISEQQRILRSTPGVVIDAEYHEKPPEARDEVKDLEGSSDTTELFSLLSGSEIDSQSLFEHSEDLDVFKKPKT